MANTIRTSIQNVAEIRADLDAVSIGLGRELGKAFKEAANLALAGAGPLTPYDPLHDAAREDGLPHIRDSLYVTGLASGAAVASRHPGAVVHEFGGTIAPKGQPIEIAAAEMAHTAGLAAFPAIAAHLEQRVSALVQQHFG